MAKAVREFTSRKDSVFLTTYLPANNSLVAPGIFQYYYDPENDMGGARDALLAKGHTDVQIDELYGVMPELQGLVESGAQVATKNTADAFGPGSKLPEKLTAYFESTGAASRSATKTLLFAGTETNSCVLASVLGAINHYCRPVVIADEVSTANPNAGLAVFDYILPSFQNFVDTACTSEALTVLSHGKVVQSSK
ncbi:unnamed protein product [Polarella glacialis]|uniref:Isochorismatase-like domain-containing protein n=1 Tax=Polarella glacialis TaxID=89957 RepID=A0A813JNE6_POLGL|nr:unnamed protein product [Polarella glacialis]